MMKDRSNLTRNPFEERKSEVLQVASVIYRANREGVEPELELTRVQASITGKREADLVREKVRSAELTVAARTAAHIAGCIDRLEQARLLERTAMRIELLALSAFEWSTYRAATVEGGIVDSLRGVNSSVPRDI